MNRQEHLIEEPIPQGKYISAVKYGNFIYTAGMTPRKNGKLVLTGNVISNKPFSYYKVAVEQAVTNALNAVLKMLAPKETIDQVISLTVYINAESSFTAHAAIADLASDFLYKQLGEKGIGARAAIGVNSLPGNAPVEIQIIAACIANK